MNDSRKHNSATLILGIMLIVAAAIWGLIKLSSDDKGRILGDTNEQRISYISDFGWDAGTVHTALEEVRIPVTFDEEYEQYNALQKEQGFDLRKYRACYVKKYTYCITNYDEGSSPPIPIYANLLVLDGEIIGADISSAEAGGFITVLAKK